MRELELFREYLLIESFEKVDPFKWDRITPTRYEFEFETKNKEGEPVSYPYKVTFNDMEDFELPYFYELQFKHESPDQNALSMRTDRGQLNKIFWTLIDIMNNFISRQRRDGLKGITYEASNQGSNKGSRSSNVGRSDVYRSVLAREIPKGVLDYGFNGFKEVFKTKESDDSNTGLIYNPKNLSDKEIKNLENRLGNGQDLDSEDDEYFNQDDYGGMFQ